MFYQSCVLGLEVESFRWSMHSGPKHSERMSELVGLVSFDSCSVDAEGSISLRKRAEFLLELLRVLESVVDEVILEGILRISGDSVADFVADGSR